MKQTEDLRRTILDASLELIAREGLGAFSMREVARRAGVSHQAPYHYFTDREAILAAICAEGFEKLGADMLAAVERCASPAERLKAIGSAYVGFALRHPAHFKLMFRSELVVPEHHDAAKSQASSAYEILVSVANEAARERLGREDPALMLAAWSVAHGLATLLLEGKLDKECGASKRAQLASADAVLQSFVDLVRPAAD